MLPVQVVFFSRVVQRGSVSRMDERLFRLLNDWQQDFPRVAEPFSVLGGAVGLPSEEVIEAFRLWRKEGILNRIGPVFNQSFFGASALMALAVPKERLDAVAALISALPEVNHNYEREHHFNLWFVVIASSTDRMLGLISEITAATGLTPIVLPMEEAYHINLGFDLRGHSSTRTQGAVAATSLSYETDGVEKNLLHTIQDGLQLVPRPYKELGDQIGLSEMQVCELLDQWLSRGLFRRFGVVLRHQEIGYTANAMCVWDIPDSDVTSVGKLLGMESCVALCYRRRRALPHWTYNLFCMIHGKGREEVLAKRSEIAQRLGLDAWPHDVLFSRRRFKLRGAKIVT